MFDVICNFNRPYVSIIVNIYNMQREIARTLCSLTVKYQQNIDVKDYEVIVVDNGSNEPLDRQWIEQHGENFSYVYVHNATPSPVSGINEAAQTAKGKFILCCIDGARILSPNILSLSLKAAKTASNPFVYTLGMHLGHKPQNLLLEEGYNQQKEDVLLSSVDWKSNGYHLFDISSTALSSRKGYFSEVSESNAFLMKKNDFLQLGGLESKFQSPGGGLVNLDFFNLVHENQKFQPILLLGEATFHQFHGGVATNVPMQQHPWEKMEREYQAIRDKKFTSSWYPPLYFGNMPPEASRLITGV